MSVFHLQPPFFVRADYALGQWETSVPDDVRLFGETLYGYIKDIKMQDNGIKVYFQILNQIPQQALIALAYELNIGKPYSLTELSRTHWAIKRINLVEVLEKAGYRVFKL